MKNTFWYKVSLKVIPGFVYILALLLFKTCRITVHGQQYKDQIVARGNHHIESFFHYGFLYIFYHSRKESGVAMVSSSKDGEYISRLAMKFGLETVRGSRNSGGMAALKKLIRLMRDGRNAGIVADGSQGPAKVVQSGTIMLASRTGIPVLPMLWSCNRYVRFNSWDKTVIPYPFSHIQFFFGEPLDVPAKIKSDAFEEYRIILEKRLNDMYVQAWKLQGKKEH
jgi:lysophospholipid acyltransferase (LPLAT)-like uncharacterized protein